MSNRILSNNVIIELDILGVYYPVFCGKTMEFVQAQELIEVTSVNSATGREYEPGLTTGNLSITGVSIIDNSGGRVSLPYLMGSALRAVQNMRIRLTDDDGTTLQISFQAIITANTLSRAVGTYSNSSVTMTVTGGVTVGPVDPPAPIEIDVYSDTWATVNGQNYVDGASTGTSPSAVANGGAFTLGATDTVLEVKVEGTEFDVITSGAPGNRQCKFNTSTFVVTFATDMIFDGTQKVFIEWKRTL